MLLWQDSLHFAVGSNMPSQMYPGQVGMGIQPLPDRNCVSITNGTFSPPHKQPSGFGLNKLTIGFRLQVNQINLTTPVDNTTFLEVRDSGGVAKMKVKLRTSSSGYHFQFLASNTSPVLLDSPVLQYGEVIYIEFQISFSTSQGRISFRTNGIISALAENLNTDINPAFAWRSVQFLFGASPLEFRLSDLYLTDGTGPHQTFTSFLGPVSGRRLLPEKIVSPDMGWSFAPTPVRLIWILGQSNAHGLGLLSEIHMPWRNPNPLVQIWSTRTAPSARWEPLEAGVNTWGHMYTPNGPLLPWFGAEMEFADRIALLMDSMPSSIAGTNIRLVKTVFDASNVDNWLPGAVENFLGLAMGVFSAAMSSLGGPSVVKEVTVIWYQGETNMLAGDLPFLYANKLIQVLQAMISFLGTIPVNFLLTRLVPESSMGIPGIDFPGEVRKHTVALETVAQTVPNCTIVSTEGTHTRDGLHLSTPGLDILGDRYFEAWFNNLNLAKDLRDIEEQANPPDSRWIGTELDRVVNLSLDGKCPVNGLILASTSRHHLLTDVSGTLKTSLGDKDLQSTTLAAGLPQWSLIHLNSEQSLVPEELMKKLSMRLVP